MALAIEFAIRGTRADIVDALRDYTGRRLSFALRNFERRIRHVIVRVVDLNGPKRGIDSRCSITVDLVGGRRIFADATTAWPFASASLAAHRVGEVLRREFGRETSRRGVRHAIAQGRFGSTR